MAEWREHGPLGLLLDIIGHIRTPLQHDLFNDCQKQAWQSLPLAEHKIYEPVKPVVTRWNSYYDALQRASHLEVAVNTYAARHIQETRTADAYALANNNKLPEVPAWMRSTGLSANDWQVVTEYMEVLKPLKEATKRLEGRGKDNSFGAIYEVIPVFEQLLTQLERVVKQFECVDHHQTGAPEDHLPTNLRAAWLKLNLYYGKLDDSPVYYTASCLHPFYKRYCKRSWRDKPAWLAVADASFRKLWAQYKPEVINTVASEQLTVSKNLDDAINELAGGYSDDESEAGADEYDRWYKHEPKWTQEQFDSGASPVKYWMDLRPKYPNLARFAIDILTIPASSCDCERVFSELGDLLEPRRRHIGAQLLAAVQAIRAWLKAGFNQPSESTASKQLATLTDEEIDQLYVLCEWENATE